MFQVYWCKLRWEENEVKNYITYVTVISQKWYLLETTEKLYPWCYMNVASYTRSEKKNITPMAMLIWKGKSQGISNSDQKKKKKFSSGKSPKLLLYKIKWSVMKFYIETWHYMAQRGYIYVFGNVYTYVRICTYM